VTAEPPQVVAAKTLDAQAASAKVAQSMARPGPSVKAEELSAVPFAGNIELLAPKKYRHAYISFSPEILARASAQYAWLQREGRGHCGDVFAGCSSTRTLV
jgi:hypothetical protein